MVWPAKLKGRKKDMGEKDGGRYKKRSKILNSTIPQSGSKSEDRHSPVLWLVRCSLYLVLDDGTRPVPQAVRDSKYASRA